VNELYEDQKIIRGQVLDIIIIYNNKKQLPRYWLHKEHYRDQTC